MSAEYWANRSKSTLASALGIGDTSLTVATPAAGQDFPALTPFRAICGTEILLVTARAGNTFTVTRGIEGTTPAAHAAGAVISHGATAGALALLLAIEAHLIPGSAEHVAATLAALLDDLYSRYYVLATTTPFDVEAGGDSVVVGALSVIARL